jgi:hypothetical protein
VKLVGSLLLLVLSSFPLSALELKVHPGGEIYLYDVEPRRGLTSAMIQNLAVVAGENETVQLKEVTVELLAGGRIRSTLRFDETDLGKAAARMAMMKKAGLLEMYDFAFQTGRYLAKETTFADAALLTPRSAILLTSIPLLVPAGVDAVRLGARGLSGDQPVEARLELPLRRYEQKNDYRFPLSGAWVNVVGPGFAEPHRWALNEEFAIDVVRLGASGLTCKGDCSKLRDYFGYGEKVLAAADGIVVAVEAGQPESNERLRQPGESGEAFMKRTIEEQEKLLTKGAAGVGGNFVVLKHAGGEYSHYMHLAAGSVKLKSGDQLKRGEVVGALGHTGNSTEPHLHFSVSDGPDPLYSRSLPVRFSGITTVDGPQPPVHVQSGWIVMAGDR